MRYLSLVLFLIGCGSTETIVKQCTVTTVDGQHEMSCPDGTSVTWNDGVDGEKGDEGDQGNPGQDGLNGTDGLNGVDGVDGVTYLVEVIDEPAGVNCDQGGQKIMSGPDSDNDGILSSSEVVKTEYVCNGFPLDNSSGVLSGNFTVNNTVDVLMLSMYDTITGNLTISGSMSLIDLPTIQSIQGNLTISTNSGIDVNMINLSSVTGDLTSVIHNPSMETPSSNINLASLSQVNNVQIMGKHIIEFLLPSLTTVSGYLNIFDTNLTSHDVNLSTLISGDYTASNNSSLCQSLVDVFIGSANIQGSISTSNNGAC